jgi:hypothetical protein
MTAPTPPGTPEEPLSRAPAGAVVPTVGRRRVGWTIGGAVVMIAMVLPVVLDQDSFPFSTYPMYSRARPAVVSIPSAIAIDGTGTEHRLSMRVIGRSDDPLIVAGELRSAIARGRADERCAEISERLGSERAETQDLVRVEVVMERHDVVAQVNGESSLIDRTVHAACPTERPS